MKITTITPTLTETEECEHGSEKEPVILVEYLQEFSIPEELTQYDANVELAIPKPVENGPLDGGDYHLFSSHTEREGWSVQKGISIKIMKRE